MNKYYNKNKYGTEQLIVDHDNKIFSYHSKLQKPNGKYAGYEKMCVIMQQLRLLDYKRVDLITL